MKNNYVRVITHLQAFMLGGYFTSQFKFDEPIEPYRWVLTSFFFIIFLIISNKENKDN